MTPELLVQAKLLLKVLRSEGRHGSARVVQALLAEVHRLEAYGFNTDYMEVVRPPDEPETSNSATAALFEPKPEPMTWESYNRTTPH